MSILEKYTKGWTFRTNKPEFDAGEEIDAFITGYENGHAVARVGDTILRVDDVPADAIDTRVLLRVEEFDTNDHTGRATFIESIDGGTF
ncbi:DUF7513 family protein [Haladaptatus salinisoli]|uniref:DUF7513 family protein n=1 Tax=Haladaptatus salinisoli TaxID=2884876 RepID=UPI001D0AFC2B|nr:hypothetical protein [Haladaptatus salinisoli]